MITKHIQCDALSGDIKYQFSTPSPVLDNEITAPVVDNEIILTTNPLDSNEMKHLEESLLKFKNLEDKKQKEQQLENILTEEMELLASLKKSEMHLKDELRNEFETFEPFHFRWLTVTVPDDYTPMVRGGSVHDILLRHFIMAVRCL